MQREVVVGQKASIWESVPIGKAKHMKVKSAYHEIIVLRDDSPPVNVDATEGTMPTFFDGLDRCYHTASPDLSWAFEQPMPNRLGIDFKFEPTTPGLFVIRPRWWLKEGDEKVYGQAVLVRVRPDNAARLAQKGKK